MSELDRPIEYSYLVLGEVLEMVSYKGYDIDFYKVFDIDFCKVLDIDNYSIWDRMFFTKLPKLELQFDLLKQFDSP